jgi:hypothetical protein
MRNRGSESSAFRPGSNQEAEQAKQRQAAVSSAAKALLADAMPELRKSMLEQLRAEAAAVKKP